MSTVGNVPVGDLAPCWHCRSATRFASFGGAHRVICGLCGAAGPAMKTELEAAQAWNAVRVFGRVGIVHGRAGIPNHTTALAENLRLVSENMAAGVYEDPAGFAIILSYQGRQRVHVIPHGVGLTEVADMAAQVASSAKTQVAISRIGGSTRS